MNRRLFLTGASTAYVASRGFSGRKLYAQSVGLDPNITSAAATNCTTTAANCWNGTFSGDDWRNLTGIHAAMRQDVQNKGLDSAFVDSAGQVGNLDPASIDLQQLTSAIQVYQPAFQLSDMQYIFGGLPKDPASLNNAMTQLRQGGLSWHLNNIISICSRMAAYADLMAAAPSGVLLPKANYITPAQPAEPEGGGYNCKVDGALVLAASTVFVVIGIMAGPAGVLALAFWGPLSFWGGVGAGAWGLGHVAAGCSF